MSEQNSRYIERHNYLEKKDTNTCRLKKHIQPTPGSFIEKGNNTATRKTFTKKNFCLLNVIPTQRKEVVTSTTGLFTDFFKNRFLYP